jgi:hypothetical protein
MFKKSGKFFDKSPDKNIKFKGFIIKLVIVLGWIFPPRWIQRSGANFIKLSLFVEATAK